MLGLMSYHREITNLMHVLIGLYLLHLSDIIGTSSDNPTHSYVLVVLGVIAGLQILRMVQKMLLYKIPFMDDLYWNVVYITHLLLIAPLFITLGLKRMGKFPNIDKEKLKKTTIGIAFMIIGYHSYKLIKSFF